MNVSLSEDGRSQELILIDADTSIQVIHPVDNPIPLDVTHTAHDTMEERSKVHITTPTTFDSSIVTTDSFSRILKEVMSKAEERDARFEQTFISNIYSKLEGDLKSNTARKAAATFLHDTFGEDLIQNYNFLRWLSKKLNFRSCRLLSLLENHKKEFQPRNKCNTSIYSQVYNYWLNSDTVIPSVESRNSRNTTKNIKIRFH